MSRALQPFRHFNHVTAHSSTLPLLHLRHSSFSNPSFASPMSQALHLRHLASRPWDLTMTNAFKCLGVTLQTTGNTFRVHVKEKAIIAIRAINDRSYSTNLPRSGNEAVQRENCPNLDTRRAPNMGKPKKGPKRMWESEGYLPQESNLSVKIHPLMMCIHPDERAIFDGRSSLRSTTPCNGGLQRADGRKPEEVERMSSAHSRFTYVIAHSPTLTSLYLLTAHSPTLPLLHLRHSSFSNSSFDSPTSQDFHLCQLASRTW